MMSTWTIAVYDYVEQVLKAQRQFAESMWATAAPMRHAAQDMTSPGAKEDRSAHHQPDARSDQHHEDSPGHRNNGRYNDGEDTAEYNKRSAGNKLSNDDISETSRTERGNVPAEESTKTRAAVASAVDCKRL